jgi:hypothetical protein
VGLWFVAATADFALAAFVAVRALSDPVWAAASDAWGGVLVLVIIVLPGQLALECSSIHAEFLATHLTVRRGLLWPSRSREILFRDVTRVRAYPFPRLSVVVNLNDGKSVKIANSMTEAVGELPEVEFEEGNHAGPIVLMRRIARLVDMRIESGGLPDTSSSRRAGAAARTEAT